MTATPEVPITTRPTHTATMSGDGLRGSASCWYRGGFGVLLIDLQQRLVPVIHDGERMLANATAVPAPPPPRPAPP
jgi:hypothetical protein